MKKSKIKYNDILNFNLIENEYKDIKKKTKNKRIIFDFELYKKSNIYKILLELYNFNIRFNKYNIFLIKEPKYRIIMSQSMLDKIINHLVSRYFLIPCLEKKLIDSNVATRKEKGASYAFKLIKKYFRRIDKSKKVYVMKLDISKYFYNINHNIMLNKLKKYFKDEKILSLIEKILDTTNEEYVNIKIKELINSELRKVNDINKINELNKIPLYVKDKGLCIGAMTSQILAIFYLDELDKYIKEELKYEYYIRYMDDLLMFSYDKNKLKEDYNLINDKVNSLDLKLNDKSRIYDANNGFNFIGYRFSIKNEKLIIKYNKQTIKRIKSNLKFKKNNNYKNYILSKASYKGYFKRGNTIYSQNYKKLTYINRKEKRDKLNLQYKDYIIFYKENNHYIVYGNSASKLFDILEYKYKKYKYIYSEKRLFKIKDILRLKNINYLIITGNDFKFNI